ncbi:MAG: phosphate regulon sensor protein PhoR, partial [Gammaproteobacteria bacterium]|nr:phosphate regulon sensor protein PhoR [Gammaproteobacteria bacterium]
MTHFWRSELWRLLLIAGLALGVGAAFGRPEIGLLVGVLGYLVWHLYNVSALGAWLGQYSTAEMPESYGTWADIFHRLYGLRKSHREEIERLQSLLERYRQTAKALPEAAVTLGGHGEIELVNEAASTLLGIKDPQDLGSPITNIVRAPHFVEFINRNRFDQVLEMVSPQDTQLMLSIRIVPYVDVGKRLLLARDITRLHKLEQIRRDFVANVSHEMKSPLTVIKGYVESISGDTSGL